MTRYLGNVYTWGNFYVNPKTYITTNDPYSVDAQNGCLYTMPDISDILSFKVNGASSNITTGDDLQFIKDKQHFGKKTTNKQKARAR